MSTEQFGFGLFDTTTNTWWGNDENSLLYQDYWIARVAAQMVDEMIGRGPGQTVAMLYNREGLIKREDNVPTIMSDLEALGRLEEGAIDDDIQIEQPNGGWRAIHHDVH